MASKTHAKKIMAGFIDENGKRKQTEIEKKIEMMLKQLPLRYESEFKVVYDVDGEKKKIRYYDFYITDGKKELLVEADGTYWHKDRIDSKSTKLQKKNFYNDKLKNIIAEKSGYKLIRFKEKDIKKRPVWIFNEICDYFNLDDIKIIV